MSDPDLVQARRQECRDDFTVILYLANGRDYRVVERVRADMDAWWPGTRARPIGELLDESAAASTVLVADRKERADG